MTIKALPSDTILLLHSSLVITSPDILIKELCENSLDARATSIDIRVSSNTIDRIQIRDNGHGISPDDFDALGRRAHTSKIEKFDDLATKGNSVYGFRGEALASANTCGRVTIRTRTRNDKLASVLVLQPKTGGIIERKPASGLFGTVVTVSKLFYEMPVRCQQYTKESIHAIQKIKEMLIRLAMARPDVKITFRVMGATKPEYLVTPGKPPSIKDVVLQSFGHVASTSCSYHKIKRDGYEISAFLPDLGHPVVHISGKGAFISVDSRPQDPSRGSWKKIIGLFKQKISQSLGDVLKPLLCINLKCPPGSYDVNVDILKFEVVFHDEPLIISLFSSLFEAVYSKGQPVDATLLPPDYNHTSLNKKIVQSKIPGVETIRSSQTIIDELSNNITFGYNATVPTSNHSENSDEVDLPALTYLSTPPTSLPAPTSDTAVPDLWADAREETCSVRKSWQVNMAECLTADKETPEESQDIPIFFIDAPKSSYNDNPITVTSQASVEPTPVSAEVPFQNSPSSPVYPMFAPRSLESPRTLVQASQISPGPTNMPCNILIHQKDNLSSLPSIKSTPTGLCRVLLDGQDKIPQRLQLTQANAHLTPNEIETGSPSMSAPQVNSSFKRFTLGLRNPNVTPPSSESNPHHDATAELRCLGGLKQTQLSFQRSNRFQSINKSDSGSPLSRASVKHVLPQPVTGLPSPSFLPALTGEDRGHNSIPTFNAHEDLNAMCAQNPSPPLLPEYRPQILHVASREMAPASIQRRRSRPLSLSSRPAPKVTELEDATDTDDDVRLPTSRATKRRRVSSGRTLAPVESPKSITVRRSSSRISRALSMELKNLPLESIPEEDHVQDLMLQKETNIRQVSSQYHKTAAVDSCTAGDGDWFEMWQYAETEDELEGLHGRVLAVLEKWGACNGVEDIGSRLTLVGMIERDSF